MSDCRLIVTNSYTLLDFSQLLWIKLQNIDFKTCCLLENQVTDTGVSQGLVHCLCLMDICIYGACATAISISKHLAGLLVLNLVYEDW